MPGCCVREEKKRKYAWNKYFQMKREFLEFAIESIKNNVLSENQKRLIKAMYFNQMDEERKCVICLEEIKKEDKIVFLNCGHIYEYNCLEEYTRNNKKCAICRTEITKKVEL